MTASTTSPIKTQGAKALSKKGAVKSPVELAAEAKLAAEAELAAAYDSAGVGSGVLTPAFAASGAVDGASSGAEGGSSGGSNGGGMGSTIPVVLGGLVLAGVAAAAGGASKDTGDTVVVNPPEPKPSYSVSASATSVNESGASKTVTFTITDANKVSGQSVSWSINGDRAADIDGATSGVATINSDGTATVTVVIKADETTEGAETLTFTAASKSVSVTINDTSTDAAKTMVLTEGQDAGADFTGTALADTFLATGQTLQLGDVLNGGDGSDTLKLSISRSAGYEGNLISFDAVSVETISIESTSGEDTNIDFSNVDSALSRINVTDVGSPSNWSSGGVNLFDLQSLAPVIHITDTDRVIDIDYDASIVTGKADAVSVNVTEMREGSELVLDDGIEVLNLTSDTVESVLTELVGDGLKTLNIDASADLEMTLLADSIGTISIKGAADVTLDELGGDGTIATVGFVLAGEAATGVIKANNLDNIAGDAKASVTTGSGDDVLTSTAAFSGEISTGSGKDSVTLGGVADGASIETDAGDDKVTLNGDLAAKGLVDLGSGDDVLTVVDGDVAGELDGGSNSDTLTLTASADAAAVLGTADISNVETLSLVAKGTTGDLSVVVSAFDDDLETINIDNQRAAVGQTPGVPVTVSLTDYRNETINVKSVETDLVATADTFGVFAGFVADVILQIEHSDEADVSSSVATVNIEGSGNFDLKIEDKNIPAGTGDIDTLNLVVSGSGSHGIDLNNQFDTKVVISGDGTGSLTIDNYAAKTVDASGYAGNVALDAGATGLVGVTFTGGAGADKLTGSTGADKLTGGAGSDTLIGGDGADTLSGGDGADTLIGDGGADTLTGGAGADRFVFNSATATTGGFVDLITDYAAGDVIVLDQPATGGPINFTNLEVRSDGTDTFIELAGDNAAGFDVITLKGYTGTVQFDLATADPAGDPPAYTTLFVNVQENGILTGTASGDWLMGGDLDQDVTGGKGADLMFGGNGNDTFIFQNGDAVAATSADASDGTIVFGNGADVIADFGDNDINDAADFGLDSVQLGDAEFDYMDWADFGSLTVSKDNVITLTDTDLPDGVTPTVYAAQGTYDALTGIFTLGNGNTDEDYVFVSAAGLTDSDAVTAGIQVSITALQNIVVFDNGYSPFAI